MAKLLRKNDKLITANDKLQTPDACGACCPTEGECYITTKCECEAEGGTFQGCGTDCDPDPCDGDTGACCIDQSCSVRTRAECLAMGGAFLGADTECSPNPCLECFFEAVACDEVSDSLWLECQNAIEAASGFGNPFVIRHDGKCYEIDITSTPSTDSKTDVLPITKYLTCEGCETCEECDDEYTLMLSCAVCPDQNNGHCCDESSGDPVSLVRNGCTWSGDGNATDCFFGGFPQCGLVAFLLVRVGNTWKLEIVTGGGSCPDFWQYEKTGGSCPTGTYELINGELVGQACPTATVS